MNLLAYDIILKIADLKNISRTAEYFNYTPSRISQILKATEEELGVALFYRGKFGLIPTMECISLLPALQHLLNSEKYFQERLNCLKNIEAGTVRIGSFSSLSCHWLPQRLKAFAMVYPQIQFELKLGDCKQIADWVRSGTIDLGLIADPKASDLTFIQLIEDSFVVILPENHHLADCETVRYEQLQQEQFIFLEPEDNDAVEDQMRQVGFQAHVQYRVKDDYTIMALVESGLGISILPRLVLNRSSYRFRTLELSPTCIRRAGIVLQKDSYISPATQRLVDFWLQGTTE